MQDLSSFAMLLLESEVRDADANNYPSDMVCDGPYQPANSPRGFRNFFRKRHKSVGSSGGMESNHNGNCTVSAKEDTVSSGSKIRNLFGPVRPRSKSEMNNFMMSVSAPKYGCRGDAERTTFAMEVEDQNSGDGGYGSVPKSPTYLHNVYKTSERHMLARRSVSVRDSPIGPDEFLEMYRSRAYSDPRLPERPRMLRDRFRRVISMSFLELYNFAESFSMVIWFNKIQIQEEQFIQRAGNIYYGDHYYCSGIYRNRLSLVPGIITEFIVAHGCTHVGNSFVVLHILKVI